MQSPILPPWSYPLQPAHWCLPFRHRLIHPAPVPVRPTATSATATTTATAPTTAPLWPPSAPSAAIGPPASTTGPPRATDAKDSSGGQCARITSTPAGSGMKVNDVHGRLIGFVLFFILPFNQIPPKLRRGQGQAQSVSLLPSAQVFQSWHEEGR